MSWSHGIFNDLNKEIMYELRYSYLIRCMVMSIFAGKEGLEQRLRKSDEEVIKKLLTSLPTKSRWNLIVVCRSSRLSSEDWKLILISTRQPTIGRYYLRIVSWGFETLKSTLIFTSENQGSRWYFLQQALKSNRITQTDMN